MLLTFLSIQFLSTLSLRRATVQTAPSYPAVGISIHALLAESDPLTLPSRFTALAFLSTLSLRRATLKPAEFVPTQTDFYPRSPCGERLTANVDGFYWWVISIHALLAESDLSRVTVSYAPSTISIHALLAESDDHSHRLQKQVLAFLSTLSLRRATRNRLD